MDRWDELIESFKNWKKAEKQRMNLFLLSDGRAAVAGQITEEDGGDYCNVANAAGVYAVNTLISADEEAVLVKISEGIFVESAVIEEVCVVARATVVNARPPWTDAKGHTHKDFIVFVDVTNQENDLKARFRLHYTARPFSVREKSIEKIRARAVKEQK